MRTKQTEPGTPKNATNCHISQLCQPTCCENVPCVCLLQLSTLKLVFISDISGSRGGWSRVEAQSWLPHAPHHPPLCLLRPQEDQDVSCIKGLFICQQKLQAWLSLSRATRWPCIWSSLQESLTPLFHTDIYLWRCPVTFISCFLRPSQYPPPPFFIISWLIFNHCQLLWASVHVWWICLEADLPKQRMQETRLMVKILWFLVFFKGNFTYIYSWI